MRISKKEKERRIKEELNKVEDKDVIDINYIMRAKKIKNDIDKGISTKDIAIFIKEWEKTTDMIKNRTRRVI